MIQTCVSVFGFKCNSYLSSSTSIQILYSFLAFNHPKLYEERKNSEFLMTNYFRIKKNSESDEICVSVVNEKGKNESCLRVTSYSQLAQKFCYMGRRVIDTVVSNQARQRKPMAKRLLRACNQLSAYLTCYVIQAFLNLGNFEAVILK